MIQTLIRIFKYAFQNFARNFWLSLATLLVMIILVLLINLTVGISQLKTSILSSVNQKIDLALFFKPGVSEGEVTNIKKILEKNEAVSSITIVTPDEELRIFQDKFPEIGERLVPTLNANPFGYELEIRTTNLAKYTELLNEVESDPALADKIERANFIDSRAIAAQAAAISEKINFGTLALTLMLGLIAVVIIFNTIRVSIYTHRDEIAIMKLVGATNWFIRAPFLVEATLYSVIAMIVVGVSLYFMLSFTQPYVDRFFEGLTVINLSNYYASNAVVIFGTQIIALLVLNAFSTSLALRRYLKI